MPAFFIGGKGHLHNVGGVAKAVFPFLKPAMAGVVGHNGFVVAGHITDKFGVARFGGLAAIIFDVAVNGRGAVT